MITASDHDREIFSHADRGDHRVEREHDVEQQDLNDDADERGRHLGAAVAFLAFQLFVNLVRALRNEEQAADEQNHVAAGDLVCRTRRTSGVVSRITQVIDHSSAMRMNIASESPIFRARARSSAGSLPARIEMNTMLSMPRTISRIVSVARAIHPSALVVHPNAPCQPAGHRRAYERRQRPSFGHVGEGTPGLGVLPDQGGQIERDLFGWIRRREVRAASASFSAGGGCEVFAGDETVLVRDTERVEEAGHHRPLMREVKRHEQTGRDHLGDVAQRHQVTRLLLDRQRLRALHAELDAHGDGGNRFSLLGRGVLVAPERFGRLLLAFRRQHFHN